MRHLLSSIVFIFSTTTIFAQSLIKIGDQAPKYNITKLINAPKAELNITDLTGKPAILAFWGTWCASCIPEMITLGKLQRIFGERIRIMGVSNDNEQKIKNFLLKRPSHIWFASDPTNNLWNIFDIETAGHAVLIDKNNKVAGITETTKIDSALICKLMNDNQLNLTEERGTKKITENTEPFTLDSNTIYSFVLQPQIKGVTSMMKQPRMGPFAQRRITIINLVPEVILREAYDIAVSGKVIFPGKEDSLISNSEPFCIDFIIPGNEKDILKTLFQKELNKHLPVKGETMTKVVPCYVLQQIPGKQILIKKSSKSTNSFSYNGLQFEGEGIPLSTFINYLENELNYPVYDATGLLKYYDINFSKENINPLQSIKDGLAKIGLELVKDKKEMVVLVISRQ